MDQSERDELLYRLDERTERVDMHLRRIDERVEENSESIDRLEDIVSDHEDELNLAKKALAGIAGLVSAIAAKVATGLRLI